MMTQKDNPPIISDLEDDPDLWEFAQHFLNKMPELLDQIKTALEKTDFHLLKRSAHTFRSSATNGGFSPLARTAARIEELSTSEDIEQLNATIDELNSLCKRVTTEHLV